MARPDVIFAAGAGKKKARIGDKEVVVGSHSRRPLQTVTPLAEALKLTPVTTHTKGEEQALVDDALGRPGIVLICWQHENIAAIGNLIVGNNTTVPQSWPEDRYDLIYVSIAPEMPGASGSSFTSGWLHHELGLATVQQSASASAGGGGCGADGTALHERLFDEPVDLRPQRQRVQVNRGQRGRQLEPARPGAAWVEVDDTPDGFGLRLMRVARDHQVEPRSRRIEVEVTEIVDDVDRPARRA